MKNHPDVNYGPLEHLIGTWTGSNGRDLSPNRDGEDIHPYYETITFEDLGCVRNADEQNLAVLHYRQVVRHKADDQVFHHQSGYWHWDAQTKTIMHSFAIPRALSVIAGGTYLGEKDEAGDLIIHVKAKLDDPNWGIIQAPFMSQKATTTEFKQTIVIGDNRLQYSQTTLLNIYERPFEHTETNDLSRA